MIVLRLLAAIVIGLIACGHSARSKDEFSKSASDMTAQEYHTYSMMKPLIEDGSSIMFWRPQKVGSSTLLSILVSYGFRFNALPRRKMNGNEFCRVMRRCGSKMSARAGAALDQVNRARNISYRMSVSHEICNADAGLLQQQLTCAFQRTEGRVKEVMMVREPLSRSISVYYFWGELYKLSAVRKRETAAAVKPGVSKTVSSAAARPATSNSVARSKSWLNNVLGRLTGVDRRLLEAGSGKDKVQEQEQDRLRLGSARSKDLNFHGKFVYHGDESTVPPEDMAIAYARKLPYSTGMPGPSYTWSLFSNSLEDGLSVMKKPHRMMTLVTERLDESLVVMMHYLNAEYHSGVADTAPSRTDWRLGDLVYVKPRKSLSSHPKVDRWPSSAVSIINSTLHEQGEFAVYDAANEALDARVAALEARGVDIKGQVQTLGQLRARVSELCFTDEYLRRYQTYIKRAGLTKHPSANKLREVEDKYSDGGHEFSINKQILYSFDVCGNCEAHAILLAVEKDIGSLRSGNTVKTAAVLKELSSKVTDGVKQLVRCPSIN